MLELIDIGQRYTVAGRDVVALSGVNVALARGGFLTVVGRSGCGKTTLLRILAGLTKPTEGSIRRNDDHPLRIGVVFQEPRLMPWLSVRGNIAFGLVNRMPSAEIERACDAVLDLVGLRPFGQAMPSQLSGGMAQRVAIARALIVKPDLLLMDEPFAALDAFTRQSMQSELVAIWQLQRPTVVFVTHDVEEAVLLGQRVLELAQGRVVDERTIDEPYPRDATSAAILAHRRHILQRLLQPVCLPPLTAPES